MNTEEIFIKMKNLPNPLTKDETYNLFIQIYNGDMQAKNILAEHNIKLLLKEVKKYFKNYGNLKKELVAVGALGLTNAINTFNIKNNVSFSTYATVCINNEINKFLRSVRKVQNDVSLSKMIYSYHDEKEIELECIIPSDFDITEKLLANERNSAIRKIVNNLPEKDYKIISMYFGFNTNKRYTQQEIADILGISQSYLGRMINKNIIKIKNILENYGIIEKNCGRKKQLRKRQNISN